MNQLREAYDRRFATAADVDDTIKRSRLPSLAAVEIDDLMEVLNELLDLLRALKERNHIKLDRKWRPEVMRALAEAMEAR